MYEIYELAISLRINLNLNLNLNLIIREILTTNPIITVFNTYSHFHVQKSFLLQILAVLDVVNLTFELKKYKNKNIPSTKSILVM